MPVPLSPRISTLASEAATMRASSISSAMRELRKTMPASHSSGCPPAESGSAEFSPPLGAESCSAWSIFSSSTWLSKGLVR